jgi:hypothetical protein
MLNNIILNSFIIVIELLNKFSEYITRTENINININIFLSKITNKIISYFLIVK